MINEQKLIESFKNIRKDIEFLKEEIKRSNKRNSTPMTVWLTGLPCSGKTTIAKRLEQILKKEGYLVARLDGDDVREGINSDLKFSGKDRDENLRRVAHIAQLLNERGLIVIASFVSPSEENRKNINSIIKNFNLIFTKCSLEECEKRDAKGMYKLAREGKIKNFTGISAPFEEPKNPELILDSEKLSVDECVEKIIKRYFD